MVKIGIIGCGGMGTRHSQCYHALSNVEVVAVADVRKELADEKATEFGCKAYYSGEDLLNNAEVDAVDICLPTFLHTPHAIKAMEKGLDVFVEKPVCLKKEEAELLLNTQKKTGAKVMVGQAIRFWDEYVWLKEAYESGKYGKLLSAVFTRISPLPSWSWENWFNDGNLSGSVALDLHVHDLDFMRFMLGEPNSFTSKCLRDSDGLIDHILTAYDYDDGVKVFIEGGWGYPVCFPFSAEYRVKFEKATVTLCDKNGCIMVYPVDGEPSKIEINSDCDIEAEQVGNLTAISAYYRELKYFTDCLDKDMPIEKATLADAAKSALLALSEIESVGGVYSK